MPASPSTARAINDRLALRLLQQEGPLDGRAVEAAHRPVPALRRRPRRTPHRRRADRRSWGSRANSAAARTPGCTGSSPTAPTWPHSTSAPRASPSSSSDLLGTVLAEASVPIDDDTGTGPAVEQAVALVERTAKEAGAERLHTVGIGAPGLIDPATGELRDSSGLPEWHRRLVAALQERLPGPRPGRERDQPRRPRRTARRRRPRPRHLRPALARPRHRRGRRPRRRPAPRCLRRYRRDRLPAGAGHARHCRPRRTARAASTPSPGPPRSPNSRRRYGARGARRPHRRAGMRRRWCGRRWRGRSRRRRARRPASSTRSPTGSPSVPPPSSPSSTPAAWSWRGEVGRAGGDVLAARVEDRLARMSPLPTEVRASALGGGAVLRGALLMARDGAQDELFAPPERCAAPEGTPRRGRARSQRWRAARSMSGNRRPGGGARASVTAAGSIWGRVRHVGRPAGVAEP